jgi:hypothetical protein
MAGGSRLFPQVLHAKSRKGAPMSSVVKKRRKKIRKHKYDKMRKKTRWQRMHKK